MILWDLAAISLSFRWFDTNEGKTGLGDKSGLRQTHESNKKIRILLFPYFRI